MSDVNNEIINQLNMITSVTYQNGVNKYLKYQYLSKSTYRGICYQLKEECESNKLTIDELQPRFFELIAENSDQSTDEIKKMYDRYVNEDKIDYFEGYTYEHTNDMLGRDRIYLENANFTINKDELIMVKSENSPNKPKNDYNQETIHLPFDSINDIVYDSNQHAFKYPQIDVKTDDEVYEVVGTGPKWLIMFYNSLKEVYESYKQ